MLVQFSIVPLGKGDSISEHVSKVLNIVDEGGLPYRITPMGTVVEGEWDEVMALIRTCHQEALKGPAGTANLPGSPSRHGVCL